MHWPQITYIALTAAGLAIVAVKHGEPRKGYNVWDALLSTAIINALLYAGGFYGA